MKNKLSVMILLVAGVLILAACGGSGEPEQPEQAASETPVSTEAAVTDAGEGEVVTMYVGPELAECTGAGPQTCMLVKYSPDEEYQYFYSQIDGFEYEPGYNYELAVLVTPVENPPADASSLQYTLVDEVSKTPADAEASTLPAATTEGEGTLTGAFRTLTSYADADGAMVDVLPETEVTAVFAEDGSLGGSSGCNSYNTSYAVEGNSIAVNELIAATMMMCSEPIMQQETVYLANLTAATTFEISGDALTLYDDSGSPTAVFNARPPTSLTGTAWQATRYNNGKGGAVSVLNGTEITAVFAEDGTVSGNASCNTYNASYEVDGGSVTIGVGASTLMACLEPEGVMEQETAYLAALTTAAAYRIQGDVLELRTAAGALAVSYVAAEPLDLTETPWLVTFHNNGKGGAVSSILGTELTLEFQDDGNITGNAGCNRYFGPYVVDGDAIQIGALATTRAFCPEPEGVMDQEQEFLTALQSAAVYSIQDDKLDLRTSAGSIAVNAIPDTPLPAGVQALVENMTFNNTSSGLEQVTLTNGVYEEAIPNSAASIQVSLLDEGDFGQIDGQPAAAVLLATNTGGSGVFIDLAVVTFENGQPTHGAVTLLGDRVQVNSVEITADGRIAVDMVTAGPEDPLCCPTQHVVKTFALQNGELVEI